MTEQRKAVLSQYKYITSLIGDLMLQVALDVYEKRDDIYRQASEGLLDDDHEEVDMNVSDIIEEMIEEVLQ